eukprot:1240625-Rhodomonas_salina.4
MARNMLSMTKKAMNCTRETEVQPSSQRQRKSLETATSRDSAVFATVTSRSQRDVDEGSEVDVAVAKLIEVEPSQQRLPGAHLPQTQLKAW